MKRTTTNRGKRKAKIHIDPQWQAVNPHAAGIDIGAKEHWVCVPPDSTQINVRPFGTCTADLNAVADWLQECGVTTVAMESTGVYWIPVFQILEARGLAVILVNARQIKNVAGRKTDVKDCQWIQRLHTYGLLQASFRPKDAYCTLRTYLRYRDELIAARSTQCQHMQKALQQMNVQLTQVLSDVTGVSGLAIIGAILEGKRDPVELSKLVDPRVKAKPAAIQKALVGDYRPEHLFVLRQAFELFHTYEARIEGCNQQIVAETTKLPDRANPTLKPLPPRKEGTSKCHYKVAGEDLRPWLYAKFGVDLTAIEGIGVTSALIMLTEVGPDLSKFPTEKHFCSWLGLCPDNRISGGKVLSSRTRRVVNRLSDALRMSAYALEHSQSALGGFHRRMKARLGAAEAITATAHKLARIIYRLIKHGENYVRIGMQEYEHKFQERKFKALKRQAKAMGFDLIALQTVPAGVS